MKWRKLKLDPMLLLMMISRVYPNKQTDRRRECSAATGVVFCTEAVSFPSTTNNNTAAAGVGAREHAHVSLIASAWRR